MFSRAPASDPAPDPDPPAAPGPSDPNSETADALHSAIMQELARMGHKDSDRDYTFAMNVYAELKHRSDATKKLIKRRILDILDDNEY